MKELKEAVIVAYGRSGVGRANKGSLAHLHPVDFGGQVLKAVLARVPELEPKDIEDLIVGCSRAEGIQGYNLARLVCLRAGIPYTTAAQTVNRFCSSGLQSLATAANVIMTGQAEVIVAGGVERMSGMPMGAAAEIRCAWLSDNQPNAYMSMGLTAENVADRYGISAQQMEAFAITSHRRAAAAQAAGKFDEEIVPLEIINTAGETVVFNRDEGVRSNTSHESLAKLQAVFKENGKVTAGTASQMSDAASFVVLMSAEKAKSIGAKPIARFLGFAVAGLDPAYMGMGPLYAIPKVLRYAGLSMQDIDVIELNEAFAAQALPCILELGMEPTKVNPNGGAIALGHPLGATGAILTCKALGELRRTAGRYGLISMCIGGGMGAAGLIEML